MRPEAIDDNVGWRRRAGRAASVALAIVVVVAITGAVPVTRSARAGAVVAPRGGAAQPAPASTASSRLARTVRRRLPEIDLDHVVVRFRSLPPDISSRLAVAGAHIARSVTGTSWTELATPNGSARRARIELARDPAIAQVAFSYIRHTLTIPNDPQWASTQSSYLSPLRLDRAWDIAKGSGITVAVIDTGVDRTHPDLIGGLVEGHNVVDPSRRPDDDNGHGTMVSGIVAARTNNQRGVVGIAPGAKVMPIKVLDANGSGSDTDIAIGIDWARTHHVNVINLSLGGSFDDPMLAAAVQNAIAANIVVVAAAGNDRAETIGFPAS
jgi:serine protease